MNCSIYCVQLGFMRRFVYSIRERKKAGGEINSFPLTVFGKWSIFASRCGTLSESELLCLPHQEQWKPKIGVLTGISWKDYGTVNFPRITQKEN